MPLNGSGGTTQPTGSIYPAVASTLIESAKLNTSIADIYTILASAIYKDGQQTTTGRIPFAAGISTDSVTEKTADTGVTLDSVLLKDGRVDTMQGADIASAGTLNLETATGNIVDVTGTTGITAITLSQGHWRMVRFTGALTITHGASLVLPGAANITTAAGDYAIFAGYASSVVRCMSYVRAATRPVTATDYFASGTVMIFAQTSAPTGWTKGATHNDKALRVVTGTVGSGGATAFTSVFGAGKSTASYQLTTADIPAHTHSMGTQVTGLVGVGALSFGAGASGTGVTDANTGSTGSNGGHSHTLSIDLQYVDVIIATKD